MRKSTLVIDVIPQAVGLLGDSRLLDSLLSSLRNHGEQGHRVERIAHNAPETTDNYAWRVRVYLDAEGKVEKVTQACIVELPDGIDNGWELDHALKGLPPPPKPVNGVVGLINFPNRRTPFTFDHGVEPVLQAPDGAAIGVIRSVKVSDLFRRFGDALEDEGFRNKLMEQDPSGTEFWKIAKQLRTAAALAGKDIMDPMPDGSAEPPTTG